MTLRIFQYLSFSFKFSSLFDFLILDCNDIIISFVNRPLVDDHCLFSLPGAFIRLRSICYSIPWVRKGWALLHKLKRSQMRLCLNILHFQARSFKFSVLSIGLTAIRVFIEALSRCRFPLLIFAISVLGYQVVPWLRPQQPRPIVGIKHGHVGLSELDFVFAYMLVYLI